MTSDPRPLLVTAENALEEALLVRDVDQVVAALAAADVYLPTPDDASAADREVPLPLVELDGGRYVPVFSSLGQLARFRPRGGGYLELPGRALEEVRPAEVGLALNPATDLFLALTPEEAARVPEASDEPALAIGEPLDEPEELLDLVRAVLDGRDDVRAAYRALLVRPPAREEPVIGLVVAAGADARDPIDAVAGAARASGVDRLALLPLSEPPADPVGTFLLEQTQPFWVSTAG